MLAIDIKDLTLQYKSWSSKQSDNVFDNLNLEIAEGDKTLILAKSDQGKTTLSRLLSNLLTKFIPCNQSGTIKLFNQNIEEVEPFDLVNNVCYVSQNPTEMFITTTVENEIAFPFETLGIKRERIIDKVESALKDWDLERYRDVSPTELSGGEKKRLLLAISFAINSKILLLDESFDDLDREYRELLSKKIKQSSNTIIVFSARYLSQFENIFDNIYTLENKTISKDSNYLSKFTHQDISQYLVNSVLLDKKESRENINKRKVFNLRAEKLEIERLRDSSKLNNFKLYCDNFSIKSGEIVRLIGNNGSGKSTLSRVLCGIDKWLSGNLYLNDNVIKPEELQTKVAYLFQNPDLQIFLPTVEQELAYGLLNSQTLKAKEIDQKVKNCSQLFNLDLEDTPSTMSFALRKFLQAGVYYLLDRDFIIFDEIDGAMSYEDAYYIIDKLSQNGAGIILITHDDNFAKSICDYTYLLKDGRAEVIENE